MSNLGEFGSLLQLGVGFGIGLSFFRAPMALLLSNIQKELADEADILEHNLSPGAARARGELSDFQMELDQVARSLDRLNLPFMIASLVGAAVNWFALIWASFSASRPLTSTEEWGVAFVSVGWFLLIGVGVGIAALWFLLPLRKKMVGIRSRL